MKPLPGRVTQTVHDLADLTHSGGGLGSAIEYSLGYDDHLLDTVTYGGKTFDFSYDTVDQLVDVDYTGTGVPTDETFTYDDSGNRTDTGYPAGDHNRLHFDGTYVYHYDHNGNRTMRFVDNDSSGTQTLGDTSITEYEWDHRNRLTRVTERAAFAGAATQVVEYEYDAFNRLIRKELDADGDGSGTSTETFWIYDGDQAVLEFDGGTAADLSHRYLWGPAVDQLLADETVDDGGSEDVLWPLTDWQGSVRHLATYDASTDVTTIANEKVYDAYGNVASETNSAVDTLFGYTGRMWDNDTGLQNNLNRWYDPVVGRWLSEDPIGFAAGDPNLYRYVGNSPGMGVDPSGLAPPSGNPSFWDYLAGEQFESEPRVFSQHRGAPGDPGSHNILDRHEQRGCGTLRSGDGDLLGHQDIRQSAASSNFAAGAWNETAFILNEIMWEVATAGIGHGVEATVEVVHTGWIWARKSRLVIRRGETAVTVGDEFVQKYWKAEQALGKKPSSLDDIGKALQRRIDDCSGAPGLVGTNSGLISSKLSREASDTLRAGARDIWEAATGRRAIWDNLQVHHRIPLEWSHLFPKVHPNRLSNLAGINSKAHAQVTNSWNAWRRSLNGRTPTQAEVVGQALRIDEMFEGSWVYPK